MKLITSVRPMRTQRSKMICIQFTENRSFTRRTTTSRGRTCRSHQSSRTNIYLTEYHSLLPLGCGMIAFCVHIVSKYVYTFFSAYLLTGIKTCEEIFFSRSDTCNSGHSRFEITGAVSHRKWALVHWYKLF